MNNTVEQNKKNLLFNSNNRKIDKEKSKINDNILDLEKKKVELLLDMGMMTYQKIRNNIINDIDFNEISNEILDVDKLIYDKNLELNKLTNLNTKKKCVCGNEVDNSDKFCSICGKNVEDEIKEYVICERCSTNVDIDSNYCTCCGSKIVIL